MSRHPLDFAGSQSAVWTVDDIPLVVDVVEEGGMLSVLVACRGAIECAAISSLTPIGPVACALLAERAL